MLDKIKGALYGLAIGDAMGATTEFMSEVEISRKYSRIEKIIGGGWLGLEAGDVTDDTAMTLAVARGLIKSPEEPIHQIGDEFLKWFETDPSDVGITIRTVLNMYKGDWLEASKKTHYDLNGMSAGNGSLMRCLPIALAYANQAKMDKFSIQQSRMTHFDEQAAEACVIYNRIASRLLNQEELKASIIKEISNTTYESIVTREPGCPPDGYVVHTFKWVLYWLLNCESIRDVVVNATNKGGDSDTIAAIAGGLKGLEVGFNALPNDLVEPLLCKEQLDGIADQLLKVREQGK